jgi:transposase
MTKRTDEAVALAADLRRQGFTIPAVASTLRVHPHTIRYWLKPTDAERRRAAARARHQTRPRRQRPPALRETFCIRLPAAMAAELERRAEAAGSRRSTVLRELLAGALGSLDDQGKLRLKDRNRCP